MKKNKKIVEEKNHNHNNDHSYENIKVAFFLNLIFAVIETIGGLLTNSISILSDAVHDLGDSISVGVSYIFEKKSKKLPDNDYSYGYLRYSLIGALITSFVLLVGSVVIIYNAVPRLLNPQEINYDAMIIFAIFGILINGYAAYKTSHGEKTNEKAINLHMLEDVFGWVAVLIGSICIKIWDLIIIDPILSILIALYILFHVYKYMKEIFNIFMERVPKGIKIDKIKESVEKAYEEVSNIHHIHVWSMDGVNNYMTCHVHLKKDLTKEEVTLLKNKIKNKLNEFNIEHITLEMEYFDEKCDDKKCI